MPPRDPDSTISTPTDADDAARPCIAARILAHPDPARVGDFAPLFDADRRGTVLIHRQSPAFRSPDGRHASPLSSRRATRSPLRVTRRGPGLLVAYDAPSPGVEVNGQRLAGERACSPEEVTAGIVVLFGKDVVLWIGLLELLEPAPAVRGLIGESTVMRRLRQQIHRVAEMDVPVLLRGETGAGKELAAHAIHVHSKRAGSKYVAVNVAGIPPTMAASELFGHNRGSYTGATESRKGYFQQADGGTLFLDEIGDITFDMQALLLRAIQHGVIQPLGGTTRHVDVRLIAATDSDLEAAVARREFREPLLRRFSYVIRVPPLRSRRDDIGMLFYHLLRERLESMDDSRRLTPASADDEPWVPGAYVAELALYEWPGNVRELSNVALNFAVENRGRPRVRVTDELRRLVQRQAPHADAGGAADGDVPSPPPGHRRRPRTGPSEEDIANALRLEGYSPERAARRLGVSKSHMYKRLGSTPGYRRASDIPLEEIRAAFERYKGDARAAAETLRISERALLLRLRAAGGRDDRGPGRA